MSSSSSESSSSSSDSVLSIHKSRVEVNDSRNSSSFPSYSYDPSTSTSFPSTFDSMKNTRYRRRYQENVDRPLEEEVEQYWLDNTRGSNSIGSDRNRRSSFRSDVTGHDPDFDISAVTVYDDSEDYPSYSDERDSMQDSAYREQYNKNVQRSLQDEVDSYQMGIYDQREDQPKQSTFNSEAYEDADFSVSGISDVGDRWERYKDMAQTTWENTKGDMDTEEYMLKKINEFKDGSENIKSPKGCSASVNKSSCCCSSKSEKPGSARKANTTFDVPPKSRSQSRSPQRSQSRSPQRSQSRSPQRSQSPSRSSAGRNRAQGSSGRADMDTTDELYEKLNDHYTKKYLQSSAGAELREYQRAMGMDDSPRKQSTFDKGRGRRDPNFSLSAIEGTGDPYANLLVDAEPTVYDAFERSEDSFDYDESYYSAEFPSSFADYSGGGTGGTYDGPPADIVNAGRSASAGRSKSPKRSSSSGRSRSHGPPAKGQGTFLVQPNGNETYACAYAVPRKQQGSGTQGSSDYVETDSIIELNERLNDHYTQRYLRSSAGAELREYQRYMGIDDSPRKQSSFDEGRSRTDPNFSLSAIEGNGDPYANVLVDAEPTVYDAFDKSDDTSYDYSNYDSEIPASFAEYIGGGARAASRSESLPRDASARGYSYLDRSQTNTSMRCTDEELMENQRVFEQRGADCTFDIHNYSGRSGRSASSGRSKSPKRESRKSSCCCSGESAEPPVRYPTQRHSSFDARSSGQEPDFDLSAIEGDGDPYANLWQGSPSFLPGMTNDQDDACSAVNRRLDQTPQGTKEYADLIEVMADCVKRKQISDGSSPVSGGAYDYLDRGQQQAPMAFTNEEFLENQRYFEQEGQPFTPDPNASILEEMAGLEKDSPEYQQLAGLLAEAEGCACSGPKSTPRPSREIPRLKVTGPSPPSSQLRPPSRIPVPVRRVPSAPTRIPVPVARGREQPPQSGRPAKPCPGTVTVKPRAQPCPGTVTVKPRAQPCPGTVTVKPRAQPCPGTVTVKPRAQPCPGMVTVKPRAQPCPGTVTVQPRATPVPGTVTVKPRARIDPGTVTVRPSGPQAWPMYDPASVKLRPARPRSKDLTYRSRAKSAAPTPSTGSGTQQSRYHPSAYKPAQAPRPRSSESEKPRWRGANAPPPAISRPPATRFVPYPPRSRATLARQGAHERSRSEPPPPHTSTQRHRAALGPPRITGYDPRVARREPRPALFQSPAGTDPNASIREEMAQMDKDSPEYRQLEALLVEAEGRPCDEYKQDDPNASLRAEMAQMDEDSPEYRQLETLLAEAEGSPSPEQPRKPATAQDASAYIRAAMELVPHDSVQYSKLMVMLMDLQGWDGNAPSPEPIEEEDPCEYIKDEMRNTDRNSTKYIQLEQMLLECEEGNSFVASPQSPCAGSRSPPETPETPRTRYLRGREDYFRMNPSVDGKRPTGLRKFSEKYPRPDIDFDPLAGGPDYSAYFAGESPRSSSPIQRTRDAERERLARSSPPRPAPRKFDERMRFHAASPRRADRWQHNPRPREPEFRRDYYIAEDLSLQNPSCYCEEEVDVDPLFAKTRSLPLDEDLQAQYKRY